METQIIKTYQINQDMSPDLQLMSIWAQAYRDYKERMPAQDLIAACHWFKLHLDLDDEES